MTNPAVAVDRLKALEIALEFTTQIAFDDDLVRSDRLNDVVDLFRRKILRPRVRVDIGVLQHFLRETWSDAVDVRQGSFDSLISGNFDSE